MMFTFTPPYEVRQLSIEEFLLWMSSLGTPQEIHAQLVELVANHVDAPLLNMPAGNPDEAGAILEGVMRG